MASLKLLLLEYETKLTKFLRSRESAELIPDEFMAFAYNGRSFHK
jgi:hypothetical protein